MRSKAFGSPELRPRRNEKHGCGRCQPPKLQVHLVLQGFNQMVETWWTHGGIFERNLRSKAPGKSWEKDGKKEDECNLLQPICFDIFHLPIPTRL